MSEDNNYHACLRELSGFITSESVSEDGLHEIFQRYGLEAPITSSKISVLVLLSVLCANKNVTEGMLRCLMEYFPPIDSITIDNTYVDFSPLHMACMKEHVTPSIVRVLIDAHPSSVRSEIDGSLPIHILCGNKEVMDETAVEILHLLLQEYPESVRHTDKEGCLPYPIHISSSSKSPEFCDMLIEKYPGSEKIVHNGCLPFHYACLQNTLPTIEYLYKLYPDAIHQERPQYPIHMVMMSREKRRSPMEDVNVISFLLGCDDNVKFQKVRGLAPPLREISSLHLACGMGAFDDYSNIESDLLKIGVLYDAYPEAIRDEIFLRSEHGNEFHYKVRAFISGEMVHARRAENHRLMSTTNERGQLWLHHAVQNNVRLGSICLLVKGNPSAVTSADRNGALPIHLACQCHKSPKVVEHLIDSDATSINVADTDGNTPLHYACRSARYEVIALLLEKYDSASVSRRNAEKKLPIELLWESEEAHDKGSAEFTESVYRLLRAFPETMST